MGEVIVGPWDGAPQRGLLEIHLYRAPTGLVEVVVRLDGQVMVWQTEVQVRLVADGEFHIEFEEGQ